MAEWLAPSKLQRLRENALAMTMLEGREIVLGVSLSRPQGHPWPLRAYAAGGKAKVYLGRERPHLRAAGR
jgi:hypothetical protein